MERKSLLIDITRCIGCYACVEACKKANGLPGGEEEDHLNWRTYTALREHNGYYVRRLCMHCNDPACMSVCPVAALQKTESGAVWYDPHKCMGCRYCMVACPFNVPTYEWPRANPKVVKCTFCWPRVKEGGIPACAEACPVEATIFGNREDILAEARYRIRTEPGKYINHIYGEKEVGGTSILFLSPLEFEKLGFRTTLPQDPLPRITWKILNKVPGIVTIGLLLLGGIWWITDRREEVAFHEKRREKGGEE